LLVLLLANRKAEVKTPQYNNIAHKIAMEVNNSVLHCLKVHEEISVTGETMLEFIAVNIASSQ
jgi:hypothetical protein